MTSDTAGKPINVRHHVPNRFDKDGAKALINVMNKDNPVGKLIHHVCIEYVRLHSLYYHTFIIGQDETKESQAGKVLTDFMTILNNNKKNSQGLRATIYPTPE